MISQSARNHYKEFICGFSAGCIETCILFPKNKMVFRQQLHNLPILGAIKQLKREGIRNLYRGLLPPLIQKMLARSIMFGSFENFQRAFGCAQGQSSFTICHASSAFLAGSFEAILCPLERVQALLQTNKHLNKFKNTREAFQLIYRNYTLREFYRGFSVIVMRNGCSNVLFFTLREPFREFVLNLLPNPLKTQNVIANFVSGATLGASISTIFFPFNVIKNRMQSAIGVKFCSPLVVLRIILAERGGSIRALYRGVQLNFSRSLFTWGITNSVYEFLMLES